MSEDRNKHDRAGAKSSAGHKVGNKDTMARGAYKAGGKPIIGQGIPKDVKRKVTGKDED